LNLPAYGQDIFLPDYAGNRRNGYGKKTVVTDTGKIELEVLAISCGSKLAWRSRGTAPICRRKRWPEKTAARPAR
jgi:hypothetical protein